jgi:YHS domain-containing protein
MVLTSALYAETGNQEHKVNEPVIALQGYSPVSYFTRNIAERGNPEFAVKYKDKIYHLASQQQAEVFHKSPQQFVPLFAEYCPYSLTLGRQVRIDPTSFKIIDGKLLLFHKSEEMDGLREWNDYGNDQELFEKANQEYLRYNF